MRSKDARIGTVVRYGGEDYTVTHKDSDDRVTIRRNSTEIVTTLGLDSEYSHIVKL